MTGWTRRSLGVPSNMGCSVVLCSVTIVSWDDKKSTDTRLFTDIFRIDILPSSLWWKMYRLALGLCFLKEKLSGKDAKDWYCFLLRLLCWNHPTLCNIHRHLKQITCCKHNCSGCELHLARAAQAPIPPLSVPGLRAMPEPQSDIKGAR